MSVAPFVVVAQALDILYFFFQSLFFVFYSFQGFLVIHPLAQKFFSSAVSGLLVIMSKAFFISAIVPFLCVSWEFDLSAYIAHLFLHAIYLIH